MFVVFIFTLTCNASLSLRCHPVYFGKHRLYIQYLCPFYYHHHHHCDSSSKKQKQKQQYEAVTIPKYPGNGWEDAEVQNLEGFRRKMNLHMQTQVGTQSPGLAPQNRSSLPSQIQNLGGHRNTYNMDHERARTYMQQKILEVLQQGKPQPQEISQKSTHDIVKRLDEVLFKTALSKEEYMRLETLEDRIYALIRRQRPPLPQLVKSSSTISTMIPTPGMSNRGTSNLMVTSSPGASTIASSGSISIAPTNVNTGNLLPPGSGTSVGINSDPFTSNDGLLSNVYPGGNNMMSSMGAQSSKSQMIRTPSSNGINSRSFMNMESSDIGNGVPSVDSTMVSQQHQQAYGLSNGALNGGLGMTTSRIQKKHGSDTPEGYLSGTSYGNGYGISSPDTYGTAKFYGTVASAGSMNNLNLDPISSQSISKSSSQSITNQSNLHHQLQQQQQCFQNQCQPNQQSQHHQLLVRNDVSSQSQLMSNLGGQIKSEQEMEYHSEFLTSQVPEQFHHSQLQNQFQQNSLDDHSRSGQFLSIPSAPPLLSQSQPIRLGQTKNEFSCPLSGAQSESLLKGQWHPHEQHIQKEFRQRNIGQDEARRNNLLSEGSMGSQAVASISAMDPLSSSGAICRSGNANQDKLVIHQQMWLLFMRHARRCQAPEGKCPDSKCIIAQKLWKHLETCPLSHCPYPRCSPTKKLFNHYRHCKDKDCPVCVPVNNFFRTKLKSFIRQGTESGLPSSTSGPCKPYDTGKPLARSASKALSGFGTLEDLHPLKRKKTDQPSQSLMSEREGSAVSAPMISVPHAPQDLQLQDNQHVAICMPTKSEFMEVKMSALVSSRKESPSVIVIKRGTVDNIYTQKPDDQPFVFNEPASLVNPENIKPEKELDQAKEDHVTLTVTAEQTVGTEFVKPKIKGVSLIELFTQKQVREHISGLRQWVGQSKAKAEKNQAMKLSMSENCCQLCAVERLTFEPPPIYCTPCGVRIRRNAMFYTVGTGVTRYYFCIPCYNETRGDTMFVGGTPIQKEKLEKRKNDEEIEEPWVQCDKCQAWQHQICALFNGRRNDDGQAEYTCPNCYITEIERGEREPLSQNAVLGAKDLPRTILSDHIERRLFRILKKERQERATLQGKSYDEVPGAEALVVRVVSSVDKKLEVKQRFHEIFQEENYPTEFPYKSKVILLFQKIEGVEVCLFSMYVQEFGSECQFPNQRRVYVSYLDSVKYFRPEIKAVNGEALRTFVYHEILIGYLEYCKKRGFTSCYIWACPPLKGEDYILYCHPEIQKTPKSDKLREWYLSMLRKASKENIVVGLTNLYDNFFVTTGECKTKVTAARLPYFDGDYWPGAAEDMICQLQQEEDERKQNRKGTIKKTITKRALKAFGRSDLSGNASKDFLLMHKLGETIGPMKEDFIMVHLQHACTHCCLLMISGNYWACRRCKKFQLCDKCYDAEQKLDDRERHPTHQREKHVLYPVEITDVPADTTDKDDILENEFFDSRQAFLSLLQGNHYQYDTLRRAKHSSMMVLYHLHNPTAPAFVITCNICRFDIESGRGWRCEVCPDYDVCDACFQKDGGIDHPHKLINHPSIEDRDAQNKEARQLRVLQLRKMLELLVHASQCRSPLCQYPNCRKVKGLFRHGMHCKNRASRGCVLCKKMWYLLQIHARSCKEPECTVPRCRDLKEHTRRTQHHSETRRRAAVTQMVRQRAAEVGSSAR